MKNKSKFPFARFLDTYFAASNGSKESNLINDFISVAFVMLHYGNAIYNFVMIAVKPERYSIFRNRVLFLSEKVKYE